MTRPTGRAAILGLMVAGLAAVGGCSNDRPAAGEARLEVDGEARVTTADGDTESTTASRTLRRGERVEVVTGTIRLTLSSGAELEGRAGHDGAAATKVMMADTPELEAGELLLTATEGVSVEAAGTRVRLEPGADDEVADHVSRSLAVATSAYTGVVTVDSAGQERTVAPLREMEIPALGRPPVAAHALKYSDSDPWDLRYLSDAMDLGRQLRAIADIYTGTLDPNEGRTVGFYQLILPALEDEPGFTAALLERARPQGETLVGAALASLGSRGAFGERWAAIFAFRDDGAEWGLVAMDQGVDRGPLLGTVEQALNGTPFEFAAGATAPPATTPGPAPPGTTPGTAPPGTTTSTTGPGTSPPTTEPPPTEDSVPDTEIPLIDDAIEPIEDLIGGLLGGDGG